MSSKIFAIVLLEDPSPSLFLFFLWDSVDRSQRSVLHSITPSPSLFLLDLDQRRMRISERWSGWKLFLQSMTWVDFWCGTARASGWATSTKVGAPVFFYIGHNSTMDSWRWSGHWPQEVKLPQVIIQDWCRFFFFVFGKYRFLTKKECPAIPRWRIDLFIYYRESMS